MCLFPKEVRFLRHVISNNELEADPEKLEAARKFPLPQNQTDVSPSEHFAHFLKGTIKTSL